MKNEKRKKVVPSGMKAAAVLTILLMLSTALYFAFGRPLNLNAEEPDAAADETTESGDVLPEEKPEIAILFTNDVHCGVDSNMGYAGLSAAKEVLEKTGKTVILADAGDAVQGDVIGTLTRGESIIDIMNGLGYSVMTLGNHEFDYGIPRLLELRDAAEFEMISVNFVDEDGETVFEPYKIVDADGVKIAFIGVSTPETTISSTPAFFMDEDGNYIYSFCEDNDGSLLAEHINEAAAAAREEGAEYVIALSHLGVQEALSPFTSSEMITKVSGVDAWLDGHSHTVIDPTTVKDKDGKEVLLAQTGTKLEKIGLLEIGSDGKLSASLLDNAGAREVIDRNKAALEEITAEVVAKTDVDLWIHDPVETDERLVRRMETNLGDLCADAIRARFDADLGMVNGGGVRVSLPAGDLTYGQIISVMPFGNDVCLMKVTGQQILDALEVSVSLFPEENGGFLQVSGMTFTVDVTKDSTVVRDDKGFVTEVGDDRRVSDVMIGEEPLDPEKIYTLATSEYIALNQGDGNTAFDGAELVTKAGVKDYDLLIDYIRGLPDSTIGEDYADPYGDGRITYIQE